MALSDLTDPQAVSQAIQEFDEIGQTAFLNKYGFRAAISYFLELDGSRYDSKAIVGAAHAYQHGTPLRADEFSGGEATVAARLTSLGFVVTRPDISWKTPLGFVGTRTDIKAMYGGSIFGGIEPSRTTPNILIYTDPEQGDLNGYVYDGWDSASNDVFHYTGEGRTGDQEIREGNKAILEHTKTGRSIRLFEALTEKRRPGGKRHRYVGAFRVDPKKPFRYETAPDAQGVPRQVIVFRLLRDEVVGTLSTVVGHNVPAPRPPAALGAAPSTLVEAKGSIGSDPSAAEVQLVPSETNTVLEFEYETAPLAGRTASRDEAKLVQHFETWLRNDGHDLWRARIPVSGERHSLVTDTYDLTAQILYEAKSGSDRATVRLGIGQLMDYLRFLPEARGALLLPEKPSNDLRALIASCGFGLAYRALGQWIVNEPDHVI